MPDPYNGERLQELQELVATLLALEEQLGKLSDEELMEEGGAGDRAVLAWVTEPPEPLARFGRLSAHPRLLVAGVIEGLRGASPPPGPAEQELLNWAEGVRAGVRSDPRSWPIGVGPIERLWNQLLRSEASEAQILATARSARVGSTVSEAGIKRLASLSWDAASQGAPGVTLARLMVAAAARASMGEPRAPEYADVALIDAAHRVLGSAPSGVLLEEAAERGKAAVQSAQSRTDNEALAEILFAIGTMYLDPYTANRPIGDYSSRIAEWLRSEHPEPGRPPMPSAEDALRCARDALRDCCAIATGRQLGFTQKALAQTLLYFERLGQTVDNEEINSLLRGALEHLDRERNLHDVMLVEAMLRGRTGGAEPDVPVGLGGSLDRLEWRYGPIQAAEMVRAEVARLADKDAERALSLLLEAAPIRRRAGEAIRTEGWRQEYMLMIDAYAHGIELPEVAPDGLLTTAAAIQPQADLEDWDPRRRAGVLTLLAARSGETNQEDAGLQLLHLAGSAAPVLAENHAACLSYLRATLLLGAAVNGVNATDWQLANDRYCAALSLALELELNDYAFMLLERVGDVVRNGGPAVSAVLAEQLAPLASRLEARTGARSTDVLQSAYKDAVAAIIQPGGLIETDKLLRLSQLTKGRRFASVITHGFTLDGGEDRAGEQLLRVITDLRQRLGQTADSDASAGESLSEEALVATYTEVVATANQATPSDERGMRSHLAELEARYDAHRAKRLLNATGGDAPVFSGRMVRAALDSQTLLVDLLIGRRPDLTVALYVLGQSREGTTFSAIPFGIPDQSGTLTGENARLRVTPLSRQIARLRGLIQQPTLGSRAVSREAQAELELLFQLLLGHIGQNLDQYWAHGKRHLCFVPHGPLHYLPFGLLGPEGSPIGAKWTVTYLPNLNLLASDRGAPALRARRLRPLSSIALSFTGRELPELTGAVPEAQAIAALFGEQAIVDTYATEAVVQEALQSSRMVHIATHGLLNAFAPAFQALMLTPTNESDGQLCAYELEGLDLRGVELVTLSACQTALGRFDGADNLRGLPAALLLAGASTVIGTLWPVRDAVAHRFFVELYTALAAGAGRLAAYKNAQATIRAQFPQYRDWGCFYYTGQWEIEDGAA